MPRSIFISSTADWRPSWAQYFADEYEKKTNIPKGSNDVIFELTGQSVDIIRTMTRYKHNRDNKTRNE